MYLFILSGILEKTGLQVVSYLFTNSHRVLQAGQTSGNHAGVCYLSIPASSQLQQPGFLSEEMPEGWLVTATITVSLKDRNCNRRSESDNKDAAAMGTKSGFISLREGGLILYLSCYSRKFSCRRSVTTVPFSRFSE